MSRLLLCCLLAAGQPQAFAALERGLPATAAATTAAAPAVADDVERDPPTPEQVLAIPPALQAMLQQRVIDATSSREERLQRLTAMIFDQQGLNLQYDVQANTTLTGTWQQRRANCLAFTLLFVTLARQAGIQARVQEVDQVVSWFQDAGVVYSVGHVNAGVMVNGRHGTADLDRNVLYGRRGPQPISDARALAHFYNNRGAQRMEAGDSESARRYYAAALAQDGSFVPAWNNLGVLDTRLGHPAQARAHFDTALRLAPDNAAALANASALLQRTGYARQAAVLQQRLQRVRRSDPFVQYLLGAQAERGSDLSGAIHYYRRAIRLYDSAHPFHFSLARAYFLAGRTRAADAELQRAHALAGEPMQARYQAKLDSLQRWRRMQAMPRAPVN